MTHAPHIGARVIVARIHHQGIVTAVHPPLREATVSGLKHGVPWSALEYVS